MGHKKPGLEALSIFVEGSFDYAHFLPDNERCFPLHGHTATAVLELTGTAAKDGMIMDYSDAKRMLHKALEAVDHKLVASEAHSSKEGEVVVVRYGKFLFKLPGEHAFLIPGEGTSENIARRLAESVVDEVPGNVSKIRLTVTEGLRKGASVTLERRLRSPGR